MLKLRTTLIFPIVLISVVGVLFCFSAQEAWATTDTFYSTASDADFWYQQLSSSASASWDTAHDKTAASSVDKDDNSAGVMVHTYRWSDPTEYQTTLKRAVVYFDTSPLPDDVTITSAVLKLYGSLGELSGDFGLFTIQVQSGMPTYPYDPPQAGDYYYAHYSGNGGILSSPAVGTGSGYREIQLTPTGLGWINKTGATKFMLREKEHDVDDIQPTYGSAVRSCSWGFSSSESSYPPILEITYETPAPTAPTVTNYVGANNVFATSARLNGEITDTGNEDPTARIYWGDNDGGTNPGNWDHVEDLGIQSGTFYKDISGLNYDVTYYYRCYASNSGGSDWADSTASFSTPSEGVATFYSTASDADFRYEALSSSALTSWNTVHDRTSANTVDVDDLSNGVWVNTIKFTDPTEYRTIIKRAVVYFDTSPLPDDVTITSAVLKLYGSLGELSGDFGLFTIQVQSGMPTYPYDPPQAGDYYYAHYSGNGGILSSPAVGTGSGYREIQLTPTGLGWVNKTGTTKFMLREKEHDVDDVQPPYVSWLVQDNLWSFYTSESSNPPILEITYATPVTAPAVTTDIATVGATEIQNDQAIFRGTITNNGGATITNIRFMWGTTSGSYPNSSGDISCSGCSTFQWTKTGMTTGTTYYYKAQASNSVGWSDLDVTNERRVVIYEASGGQQSFTTPSLCDCTSNVVGGCCDGCYFCPEGTVNNGAGSCVTPNSTYYCNSWEDCDDGDCQAARRWYGCTGTAETCSATSYQTETITASNGYVFKADCSQAVLSCTDYCGTAGYICSGDRHRYQNRLACGVTGSCNGSVMSCHVQDCGATSNTCSSKCQKDYQHTCSASTGVCGTYHAYTTASQGYRCETGSLINTGSCATSAYNDRSADKCDKKRDLYLCDGLGFNDANCNYDVDDEWAYVSANKIANSSGQEVEASSADNTGTCHVCTAGTCSGTYHWGECDGSGNAGPCLSYNQQETVYAQEGYTLISTCETNGTTYCLTDQCRDGGGWHHLCSQRCDAAHNCEYWIDASCVDHCTNSIQDQDCDETGVDCGGSCLPCDTTPPTTEIRIFDSGANGIAGDADDNDVTETKEWLKADTYTIKLIATDETELQSCEYYILAFDPNEEIISPPTESCSGTEHTISIEADAGKIEDKPETDYWREGVGKYLIWFTAIDQAGNEPIEAASKGLNFDFTPPETWIE